jgi:hypothetical protein
MVAMVVSPGKVVSSSPDMRKRVVMIQKRIAKMSEKAQAAKAK